MTTFKGGEKLARRLQEIAAAVATGEALQVGYLAGSTMRDGGVSLPMVAAIQNYGAPAASIPPRPFFTNMVKIESPQWGGKFAKILRYENYNAKKALGQMGELIKADLGESVINTNEPPLSPITLMLRMMRSKGGPDFKVTGRTVGEAAARVRAGEVATGVSIKPLVATPAADLINGVEYRVK